MSRVVTLEGFTPGERNDGNPWTQARMEESPAASGAWSAIQTFDLATGPGVDPAGLDPDPRAPQARSFTSTLAQLGEGYYRIVFIDAAAHEQATAPVFDGAAQSPYSSVVALRAVLSPRGVTDAASAASLSDDELDGALQEAAEEIDARLASRYLLPLQEPVPPILAALNRDIAAYLATLTFRGGDPIDPNDPVQKRYDRAQALLVSIQTGKTELPIATGSLSEDSAEAEVVNPYFGDLFLPVDFNLGPAPYRGQGIPVPGYDDDGLV